MRRHCVCIIMTHRLICSMTYLVHSSGHSRSNLQVNISRLKCRCFEASRREVHDGMTHCLYLFSSKVICKHVDSTKEQQFLFDLHWKGQNMTKTCQTRYGCIYNILRTFSPYLLQSSFVFCNYIANESLGGGVTPQVRSRMAK